MSNEEQKDNGIGIEYLVDLLSSVKSALSNIDNHNTQMYGILSELSENVTIVTELYKRQNQDQKVLLSKYDSLLKIYNDLSSKVDLSNQEIISSHDKLSSNLSIISGNQKDTLDGIKITLEKLQTDIVYIRDIEKQKELVKTIEAQKHTEAHPETKKETIEDKKNFLVKAFKSIKNISEGISILYKILLLIFGATLVTLWFTGVITWEQIKHISMLKFFIGG